MSQPHSSQPAGRPTPDLLLPFGTAVGLVVSAIIALAVAQTVVALIGALVALVVLLGAVIALVTRVMTDEGDDLVSPSASSPVVDDDVAPTPITRRRHHLPLHHAA